MATNIWKELPETGASGDGILDINGAGGPSINIVPGDGISIDTTGNTITITNELATAGTLNSFAGFDGSGNLESVPGFLIDTVSGGMNETLTEHPDAGEGFTANSFNVNFEPLQNSPDEDWTIQNIQVNMDNASSGFSQGTNGGAIQLLNLNIDHLGTGNVGSLNSLIFNSDIGNGTDPITVKGMGLSFGFGNVHENVTLDGQLQGYTYQVNVDASANGTSNFGVFPFNDSSNIGIPVNGYASYNASPSIASITTTNNYTGININPNIAALSGTSGAYGLGFYPTISTTGANSNIVALNSNFNINLLGTNADVQGVTIGGTITTMGSNSVATGFNYFPHITTSHGNISGLSISPVVAGGDASFTGITVNPSGGATLNDATGIRINLSGITSDDVQGIIGLESDSRLQINGTSQLRSAQGFQIGSRIAHEFTVPNGSPVTGTDELGINVAGDFLVQDNVSVGPIGIGFNSVGFIASLGVAATKTVDSLTVFLPASSLPDPGFTTGGNVTDFHIIRTFPPLPQGGTLNITNLYGLKIDSMFGSLANAATNAYGLYIDGGAVKNWLSGKTKLGDITYSVPTASLHLPGSSTVAESAPLKIDSGTLMTAPENGAVESDGTDLYWTDDTGTRQKLNGAGSLPVGTPIWTKYTFTFTDFSAASTEKDLHLFNLATGQIISNLIIKTSAAFTGGTITSYQFNVGITNPLYNDYINLYEGTTAPAPLNFQENQAPSPSINFDVPIDVRIEANTVGDNLDQATTGSVDVWIQTQQLP